MKGKIKIELFEDGKKVREETHHNTFQGGIIQSWFAPIGSQSVTPYTFSDVESKEIWKHLVGGLLLLDDSDNLISIGDDMVPAGVKMTGNGAYGVSNTEAPVEMGSYNTSEEVAGNDSISMVWDFTTAQANGKITTVALTTDWGGYAGYGNASQTNKSSLVNLVTPQNVQRNEVVAAPMNAVYGVASNGKQYRAIVNWASGTVTLYERDPWYDSFDLIKSNPKMNTTWTSYDLTFTAVSNASYYETIGMMDERYLIMLTSPRTIAPNDQIAVLKIDCLQHTVTRYMVTNTTGLTIKIGDSTGPYTGMKAVGVVDADTILVHATDNDEIESFLLDISTSVATSLGVITTAEILSGKHTGSTLMCQLGVGGKVIMGNLIFDKVDGTLYPTNGQFENDFYFIGCQNHRAWAVDKQYNMRLFAIHNPMMMHTIAVLDDAVTKTSQQSMKVTYTLTRA